MIQIVSQVFSFTIAISGAHGGLGRELVQQSLSENFNTLGLVRRMDPIFYPYRNGWLRDDEKTRYSMSNLNLTKVMYEDIKKYDFDAMVFALSGKPFKEDNTTYIIKKICENLPESCQKVCFVSAYGVGDSINDANVGIQIMSDWYLKDVYRSKYEQEKIVENLAVDTLIIRPRVLSYGKIPFNTIATPRQELAKEIIEWCKK